MLQLFTKQDHPRMNVARDQTIILGLKIFLDHRSLSSIDQKIFMTLYSPKFILVHERSSSMLYVDGWMGWDGYHRSEVLNNDCPTKTSSYLTLKWQRLTLFLHPGVLFVVPKEEHLMMVLFSSYG